MTPTDERETLRKLFITAFEGWQTITRKVEELEVNKKALQAQCTEIETLIMTANTKKEELKAVMYFLRGLFPSDEVDSENS